MWKRKVIFDHKLDVFFSRCFPRTWLLWAYDLFQFDLEIKSTRNDLFHKNITTLFFVFRIPQDHLNDAGDKRKFSVFCIARIGSQIYDTR